MEDRCCCAAPDVRGAEKWPLLFPPTPPPPLRPPRAGTSVRPPLWIIASWARNVSSQLSAAAAGAAITAAAADIPAPPGEGRPKPDAEVAAAADLTDPAVPVPPAAAIVAPRMDMAGTFLEMCWMRAGASCSGFRGGGHQQCIQRGWTMMTPAKAHQGNSPDDVKGENMYLGLLLYIGVLLFGVLFWYPKIRGHDALGG